MNEIYLPSGKSSPLSYLLLILVAGIIAPVLAVLYTLGVWFIPIIYLNVLLTAGLGFALGITLSFLVVRIGKVRSPKMATVFGIITGLIAIYFSYATWLDLVINTTDTVGTSRIGISKSSIDVAEILRIASHPGQMVNLIMEINKFGTWGMFGMTFSGILLYLIWLIEFGIVLFFSVSIARGAALHPFCEEGNNWFKKKDLPAFNAITSLESVLSYIQSSPTTMDETLVLEPESAIKGHSIFTVYSSDFSNQNFLTITNKIPEVKDNGAVKFEDAVIVENVSISETMALHLDKIKVRSPEPTPVLTEENNEN